MLLSARWIVNVGSVNSWDYSDNIQFSEGDPVTVYLQLTDMSREKPLGKRYVAASGSTLQVTVTNLDNAKAYTKVATQPFPTTDPSIWSFTISANDKVKGTPSLQLALTEGAVTVRTLIKAAIRVASIGGV